MLSCGSSRPRSPGPRSTSTQSPPTSSRGCWSTRRPKACREPRGCPAMRCWWPKGRRPQYRHCRHQFKEPGLHPTKAVSTWADGAVSQGLTRAGPRNWTKIFTIRVPLPVAAIAAERHCRYAFSGVQLDWSAHIGPPGPAFRLTAGRIAGRPRCSRRRLRPCRGCSVRHKPDGSWRSTTVPIFARP